MNPGLLSLDDAAARLLGAAQPLTERETVDTFDAAGRVLAAALVSAIDVPAFDNSMMDGYAVRSADLAAPGARLRVSQRIAAGVVGHRLEPGTAARIFTGAPLPEGADAVVMQERCRHAGDAIEIDHVPHPGEWITRAGADLARGREVLAAGTRLAAPQLGVAASAGVAALEVFRRLRVALFSTGSELAMPGQPLAPGAIYNSNRYTLRALLAGLGCAVSDFGIVPDRLDDTRAALRRAAGDHDLILTSGGVSVGEEDHVRPAVQAEGRLDLWKIAIKPGKPLAYGRVGDAHFIGLPGNPVSSFVTFVLLVRPFVLKLAGAQAQAAQALELRAGFDWPHPDVRREFLRARRNEDGSLAIHPDQSAAVLSSVAWADGLVDVPPGMPIARGDAVRFLPFSDLLC